MREPRGERFGVVHDLLLICLEPGLERFVEADGLGRDDVHERAALDAGEDLAVDVLGELLLADDDAAARAAQALVRGGGDEIRDADRARMHARGDEAGDVRHVHEKVGADAIRDLAHALEIDDARVGGRAGGDHLRLILQRLPGERVVVDALVLLAHAVMVTLCRSGRRNSPCCRG